MAGCSTCHGSGKVGNSSCMACGGLGYFEGGQAADDFAHGRRPKGESRGRGRAGKHQKKNGPSWKLVGLVLVGVIILIAVLNG